MRPVSKPSDERRTPRWFFERCDSLWGPFDLDAAADKWNHQVRRYCTAGGDVLRHPPRARRVWLNPPYSRGQLERFLGLTRSTVLDKLWDRTTCLVPMDPSTDWWKQHVARPEGRKLRVEWLTGELPPPFHLEAYRLVSEHLVVTIAPPDVRLAFDPPPWLPPRELEKFRGAKQPSVVVVFERNR